MPGYEFLTLTDQVTNVLREGMLEGRWRGVLPGRDTLAKELKVSHRTVESAMRRLGKEGLLVSQGPGQRRRIMVPEGDNRPNRLRVRILPYEPKDQGVALCVDLQYNLKQAGFAAAFTTRSLQDLNMDVKQVARFVAKTPADAWIVCAASREVLEWFSSQPVPAFAFFGVKSGLPIPGVAVRRDPNPIIERLVALGHRRIVLLEREEHVKPKPGVFAQSFLDGLYRQGIKPSSYHLPAWGSRPEELHRCLDSLLKLTAPTAFLVVEAPIFIAARDYLALRGVLAPRDVSLICLDTDVSFSWCDPEVTHFTWEHLPVVRRVVRWAQNIARGKEDRRQTFVTAKLVEGGTIGPVRKHDLPFFR